MPLEPLFWKEAIPGLDQLEGLYLEFIEVHVPVLQSMPRLSKLRCALGQRCLQPLGPPPIRASVMVNNK